MLASNSRSFCLSLQSAGIYTHMPSSSARICFILFLVLGIKLQGFTLVRQVLYHLNFVTSNPSHPTPSRQDSYYLVEAGLTMYSRLPELKIVFLRFLNTGITGMFHYVTLKF
jgi:hypothetical protein